MGKFFAHSVCANGFNAHILGYYVIFATQQSLMRLSRCIKRLIQNNPEIRSCTFYDQNPYTMHNMHGTMNSKLSQVVVNGLF